MKYSEKNKPLICMQTTNRCYQTTRTFTPKGVLWHDTASDNPWLKRYVQPSDNAKDREEWLQLLGKNQYGNDWNHTDREASMNCWIGKLADGTVTTVQTMPWNYRPWGCGSGSKGSCNNTHIQFEICEDNLTDKAYFEAAYKEACEITAYLCKLYNIDPHGTTVTNGVTVPTILCHQDSYRYGLGSDHSDIYDWLPKYNKNMETVRDDVAALLNGTSNDASTVIIGGKEVTVTLNQLKKGSSGTQVETLQALLLNNGYKLPKYGADSDYGSETETAVKQFQKDNSLEADGIVGKNTWNKILKG